MQQAEIPGDGGIARVANYGKGAMVGGVGNQLSEGVMTQVDGRVNSTWNDGVVQVEFAFARRADDSRWRGGLQNSAHPLRACLPMRRVENCRGQPLLQSSYRRYQTTFAGSPFSTALAGTGPLTRVRAHTIAPWPT